MKGIGILFIIGILLIVSKWRNFIIVSNFWIVSCFVLWFLLIYISTHKKNKDKHTPQAVYVKQE